MRLRQVVVVTRDLSASVDQLTRHLALPEPFFDPGVGEFGLENRVFAVGHDFLEVLNPVREGTAGGRYLDRRGGDAGYMAIFQVDDLPAARRRVDDLGLRVVWQADLPDIAGTHLHPADVPGAIVSLDAADPAASWHWAGPRWRGGAPSDAPAGGLTSLTIAALDPPALATRWADVLGLAAQGSTIPLPDAGQELRFVPSGTERPEDEGIVGFGFRLVAGAVTGAMTFDLAGVRVEVEPAS